MRVKYMEHAMLFKALADANRLMIVDMLSCGELCACRILEKFEITQPTLSHHMKILCGCGLVVGRKEGIWTHYSLDAARVQELKDVLCSVTSNKNTIEEVFPMKPVVDFKRCFSSKNVCTAIKCCPARAVSYIEVDEPIMDKFLNCNCSDPNRMGKAPVSCNEDGSGCDCANGNCGNDLYGCGGTPYGRIIIDYDKCTRCGLCVKECCGTAIGLYPEDYVIEPVKGNPKCCCAGGCC